jgi:hypothetical protein
MDVCDSDVIRSLRNSENVKKLVNNERNKLIINTKGAYYLKNQLGKYELLTGLLPRLRKTFYPDINIFNLLKKPKTLTCSSSKQQRKKRYRGAAVAGNTAKKAKGSKGWHYGKIRGTIVHEEIEDFIFFDKKNFRKKHPSIHIYTHRILKFIMETMGWTLLRSEFDIFDEALRLGTSIDIVAVTRTGQLVLIEVKCGFPDYFDRHDGHMRGPLHKLTDSPHNQANIQLITEALLVVKNHRIPLNDLLLYVIRVDDNDLYYYKINNEYVQKKGAKIYNQLLVETIQAPSSSRKPVVA